MKWWWTTSCSSVYSLFFSSSIFHVQVFFLPFRCCCCWVVVVVVKRCAALPHVLQHINLNEIILRKKKAHGPRRNRQREEALRPFSHALYARWYHTVADAVDRKIYLGKNRFEWKNKTNEPRTLFAVVFDQFHILHPGVFNFTRKRVISSFSTTHETHEYFYYLRRNNTWFN